MLNKWKIKLLKLKVNYKVQLMNKEKFKKMLSDVNRSAQNRQEPARTEEEIAQMLKEVDDAARIRGAIGDALEYGHGRSDYLKKNTQIVGVMQPLSGQRRMERLAPGRACRAHRSGSMQQPCIALYHHPYIS